MKERKWLE